MEDFVTFEIAKKLKEKGFTLPKSEIIGKFDSDGLFHSQLYINFTETMEFDEIIAPTISQVLEWLRKDKKILITIIPQEKNLGYDTLCFGIYRITEDLYQPIYNGTINTLVDSYEQVALAGIEYVLDNLI